MTTSESGDVPRSLIERLVDDHREAKELLERFDALAPSQRVEGFGELTHVLVRHEVAEEQVVYPALRRFVDGGGDLADMRIAEQAKAEHLLADMERAGVASPEFSSMFTTLRTEVLTHADAEEQSVFPELTANVSGDDLRALATRYEMAKKAAPAHPHRRVRA